MGLFLGPFSGHATGGGGHGVIDPPPPGTDPGGGPRSEVDTVGRSPLRLLRTTMARHKPKFMKIVPPGQQRGTLAPPYTWDTLERPDWRYETPNRSALRMGEGEFDAPKLLKPKPLAVPAHHAPGGAHKPQPPRPQGATATASPKKPDPRHAQVERLVGEINKLRAEVKELLGRQQQLTQHGKRELASRPKFDDGERETVLYGKGAITYPTHTEARDIWVGDTQQQQSIQTRRALQRDKAAFARRDSESERLRKTQAEAPDSPEARQISRKATARNAADNAAFQQHFSSGQARRDYASRPKASFALLQVHKEIQQKRAQIDQLNQQLHQLRQQIKSQPMESAGLNPNNLRRISLLLK